MNGDHYPQRERASGDLSGAAFLAAPRFIPHEVGGWKMSADGQQSGRCCLVTKPFSAATLNSARSLRRQVPHGDTFERYSRNGP